MCQVLASAAAFFFFVACVLSIVSTSMADWTRVPGLGVGQGLWARCQDHNCVPTANHYTGGCLALLNVVRAFQIMTIILSCFAFLFCYMLAGCLRGAAPCAFLCGALAAMFSVVPWAVWLGFENQCVPPLIANITHGSGWSLAVSACPIAYFGFLLLVIWCLACYHTCGQDPSAGLGGAGAACCVVPTVCPYPVPACPCPCPSTVCCVSCPQPCCTPGPCPCPCPTPVC